MFYSLHLIDKDWAAIRDALAHAGHHDVISRMDAAPRCMFCRHHPRDARDKALYDFLHDVGGRAEILLGQVNK
jgi:hypothetical protein